MGDPYYRFPLFYTKKKPGEVGKIMNKQRIAGFDGVEPEAMKRESYLIARLYPIKPATPCDPSLVHDFPYPPGFLFV